MSEPTSVRRYSSTRQRWLLVLLAVITAMGVIVIVSTSKQVSTVGSSTQPYENARRAYEATLLQASDRIDSDFGVYVDDAAGGMLYTAYISRYDDCTTHCMTARKVAGGYALTLPVSYRYSPDSQDFDAPFTKRRVASLTYWDSSEHIARTVTAQDGASVKLPAVLYSRSVDSVKTGEIVYVTPDYIRRVNGNAVVLKSAFIRNEPSGGYYGLVELARLVRTQTGFTACLPKGYGSVISDPTAVGESVTITAQRC